MTREDGGVVVEKAAVAARKRRRRRWWWGGGWTWWKGVRVICEKRDESEVSFGILKKMRGVLRAILWV